MAGRVISADARRFFHLGRQRLLKYPIALWAISQIGNRYKFAAMIGHSESWLSRRLLGRVPLTPHERETIAQALGYPAEWLFQEPQPPTRRMVAAGLVHTSV
jgi:hypothetical protein